MLIQCYHGRLCSRITSRHAGRISQQQTRLRHGWGHSDGTFRHAAGMTRRTRASCRMLKAGAAVKSSVSARSERPPSGNAVPFHPQGWRGNHSKKRGSEWLLAQGSGEWPERKVRVKPQSNLVCAAGELETVTDSANLSPGTEKINK